MHEDLNSICSSSLLWLGRHYAKAEFGVNPGDTPILFYLSFNSGLKLAKCELEIVEELNRLLYHRIELKRFMCLVMAAVAAKRTVSATAS